MRLLEHNSASKFSLTKDFVGDDVPGYAILSHTWGPDTEEVTFKDLIDGTGKHKNGYNKIRFCGKQAKRDGLQYFWVDTCCINKSNNTELSEAINSMFRWYWNAAKCYVYLSDVSSYAFDTNDESSQLPCESALRESRWFTRGWTLQELLAPGSVEFFSREGNRLGDKRSLERKIHEITGIAVLALRGTPLSQFGVDERFSWAENRQTTRKEDKAYSLLGIFDVYMPLIYGEGSDNAFTRLREEIDKPSKELDRLPYAVEAPFNSYAKQHSPSCLPNTRVELLREIYSWADRQDEQCIFWLNGLAGTGKSTIARTIAWEYSEQVRLGASFFFARGGGDVGHAGKFVTSIAVQLAIRVPTLRRHISDAVTEHSDIASRSLRDQWQLLILGPLSKLDGNGCCASYVLVVDALDECDDNNNIRIILQLLAKARSLKRVRVRVFLTSRPEVPIRHGFYQISKTEHYDFVLHNISPSIVDYDILIFLEYNLKLIGEEDAQDPGWPGAEVIKTLVQSASGLFIWAATACRFIREGLFADERLCTLLKGGASAAATPEEHLNGIYITVLQNSIQSGFSQQDKERFCSMLRDILGSVVALFSPISIDSLSRLLVTPKQRLDQMLKNLHAILDIPNDHTRALRLHHPSFRDFLLDKNRCSDQNFLVNEKQAHRTLAARCIQIMSTSLKEDICNVGHPGVLVADIESSQIQQCLPPEVQYACLYWIQHLQKSGAQLRDNDQVHQFLQEHLLHWLETLCWMRRLSEGIRAISVLDSILDSTALAKECSNLRDFIYDIKRFALSSRTGIEQAPLQTYSSALIFAPMTSIVRNQFKDRMPRWIGRLPKVKEHWNTLLQTLEGHRKPPIAVAFSSDGQLLASGALDSTVRLWNPSTAEEIHRFQGHSEPVLAVVFLYDQQLLASVSEDNIVRLWNLATKEEVQRFQGYSERIKAAAFSYDGQLLALASDDNIVRLWNLSKKEEVQQLQGHNNEVRAIAFSHDNQLLASASWDETVRLWNTTTGEEVQRFLVHLGRVVALSSDGQLLAAESDDNTVSVWNSTTGEEVQRFEWHNNFTCTMAFSHNGQLLALSSDDSTVRLWNPQTGEEVQQLQGHTNTVSAITFSSDDQLLASASWDGTLRVWNLSIGEEVQQPQEYSSRVSAVIFSPDDKVLVSASVDGTIRLWNAAAGQEIQQLQGHNESVQTVAFSHSGQLLVSVSGDDRMIKLWNPETGEEVQQLQGCDYYAIAFSHNDQLLASALYNTVRLWNPVTGVEVERLQGHSGPVYGVAFSYNDQLLASASADKTVIIWNLASGEEVQRLEGHSDSVYAVAFSRDHQLLASASHDNTVMLWNPVTGEEIRKLQGHSDNVRPVVFSPTSHLLASASHDGTVRLWNPATGEEVQKLPLHTTVSRLCFSGDSQHLETDRGALLLSPHPPFLSSRELRSTGTIFLNNEWITRDSQYLLWLPHDYRGNCSALGGNCLAIGQDSGAVSFFHFDC